MLPRYFFHIHDGADLPDDEGTDLPNLDAARNDAVRLSGEMLRDSGGSFWNSGEWSVEVADEAGLTLFTLTFFATDAPVIQTG